MLMKVKSVLIFSYKKTGFNFSNVIKTVSLEEGDCPPSRVCDFEIDFCSKQLSIFKLKN